MNFSLISSDKRLSWCFLFILCFLLGLVFSYAPYSIGDKTKYILTTESLLHDRDLVSTPDVVLKRHLAYKPGTIDYTPGEIYLLQNTGEGKVRFAAYSFYCSLFVASFYAVFSVFGHHIAYYSFYFANAILFFVCLVRSTSYRMIDEMERSG